MLLAPAEVETSLIQSTLLAALVEVKEQEPWELSTKLPFPPAGLKTALAEEIE